MLERTPSEALRLTVDGEREGVSKLCSPRAGSAPGLLLLLLLLSTSVQPWPGSARAPRMRPSAFPPPPPRRAVQAQLVLIPPPEAPEPKGQGAEPGARVSATQGQPSHDSPRRLPPAGCFCRPQGQAASASFMHFSAGRPAWPPPCPLPGLA